MTEAGSCTCVSLYVQNTKPAPSRIAHRASAGFYTREAQSFSRVHGSTLLISSPRVVHGHRRSAIEVQTALGAFSSVSSLCDDCPHGISLFLVFTTTNALSSDGTARRQAAVSRERKAGKQGVEEALFQKALEFAGMAHDARLLDAHRGLMGNPDSTAEISSSDLGSKIPHPIQFQAAPGGHSLPLPLLPRLVDLK
jgi:hypothetical protein